MTCAHHTSPSGIYRLKAHREGRTYQNTDTHHLRFATASERITPKTPKLNQSIPMPRTHISVVQESGKGCLRSTPALQNPASLSHPGSSHEHPVVKATEATARQCLKPPASLLLHTINTAGAWLFIPSCWRSSSVDFYLFIYLNFCITSVPGERVVFR